MIQIIRVKALNSKHSTEKTQFNAFNSDLTHPFQSIGFRVLASEHWLRSIGFRTLSSDYYHLLVSYQI
jgi:hypothetical protein